MWTDESKFVVFGSSTSTGNNLILHQDTDPKLFFSVVWNYFENKVAAYKSEPHHVGEARLKSPTSTADLREVLQAFIGPVYL